MQIEIYSKTDCPFCHRAKLYFRQHGIPYREHILDDVAERHAFYARIGDNIKTVPQIFVDGVRLGGYNELISSDLVVRYQAGRFNEDF